MYNCPKPGSLSIVVQKVLIVGKDPKQVKHSYLSYYLPYLVAVGVNQAHAGEGLYGQTQLMGVSHLCTCMVLERPSCLCHIRLPHSSRWPRFKKNPRILHRYVPEQVQMALRIFARSLTGNPVLGFLTMLGTIPRNRFFCPLTDTADDERTAKQP